MHMTAHMHMTQMCVPSVAQRATIATSTGSRGVFMPPMRMMCNCRLCLVASQSSHDDPWAIRDVLGARAPACMRAFMREHMLMAVRMYRMRMHVCTSL